MVKFGCFLGCRTDLKAIFRLFTPNSPTLTHKPPHSRYLPYVYCVLFAVLLIIFGYILSLDKGAYFTSNIDYFARK